MKHYFFHLGPQFHRILNGKSNVSRQLVQIIVRITTLKVSDIYAHMTTNGGIIGLPVRFLMDKAQHFANMGNMRAFEIIFALLV